MALRRTNSQALFLLSVDKIIDKMASSDPVGCWREVCRALSASAQLPNTETLEWDTVLDLHRRVFGSGVFAFFPLFLLTHTKESIGPGRTATAPVWVPSEAEAAGCNASRMAMKLGFVGGPEGYKQMIEWAADPANRNELLVLLRRHFGFPAAGEPTNLIRLCFAQGMRSAVVAGDSSSGELRTTRLSYKEMELLCFRVGTAIKKILPANLPARVSVIMPMTPLSCAVVLGLVGLGVGVVPIAESFSAAEMATRMQIGETQIAVTVDGFIRGGRLIEMAPRVREACKLAGVKTLIVSRRDQSPDPLEPGELDLASFLAMVEETVAWPNFPPDTVSWVLFSSGTTGTPKAIPWTHDNALRAGIDAHVHIDVSPGDVVIMPTSHGWMMGPWLMLAALLNGAAFALPPGAPTGPEFFTFLRTAGVTVCGVVPTMVKNWRAQAATHKRLVREGLSRIKCFLSTGEASSPELYFWLMAQAQGIRPVMEYIGGTEIGGAFLSASLCVPAVPSAFFGPTIGNSVVLLSVSSEEDQGVGVQTVLPSDPGSEGELAIYGHSIGHSTRLLNRDHDDAYFKGMPSHKGVKLRRHGDRMTILTGLASGYFRSDGRCDDAFNLGGVKVSSAELEHCIVTHVPGVRDCAAVGPQSPGGGLEVLVVYLVPVESARPLSRVVFEDTVRQAIRTHLNPFFHVEKLFLVSDLPRTASQKVMRRVLRDRAAEYLCLALAEASSSSRCSREAVIAGYGRTPFGTHRGSLKQFSATQLGGVALRGTLRKHGISPGAVEAVYVGNVCAAGLGQNPARQCAMVAGCPVETSSITMNKVCASGMVAVATAAKALWLGEYDLVAAGGTESMSNVPMLIDGDSRSQLRPESTLEVKEPITMRSGLMVDGLIDAYSHQSMGVHADAVARKCNVTRGQQDDYAEESFKRAQADVEGTRDAELVGLEELGLDRDEGISKLNAEKMRSLKPAFVRDETGSVTAANASQVSDGSAFLILCCRSMAAALGLTVLAVVEACADAATVPEDFPLAPASAVPRVLELGRVKADQVGVWEINEAFACVPLAVAKRLGIKDFGSVNVYGGAVARGHPLGASGTRIIIAMLRALRERGEKYGCAGVCNGGGGASAILIRNTDPVKK